MAVPFVDLKRQYASIKAEIDEALSSVVESCGFIGGPNIENFEKEMAAHQGTGTVGAVANCTIAISLTLESLGIGAGDEVITTVHTAIPTAEAITMSGARVVFVDIEAGGFNIDPEKVRAAITPKTKAIIPVHLYGIPANLDALCDIAREHGLRLIEDVAQAQGARWKDKRVGTYGDAACFSFFPSKNLGAFGDAGAMASGDPELVKKVKMLSNHGRVTKLEHLVEGTNNRMDALQAAILRVKLKYLDKWNDSRRTAADCYVQELGEVKEVALPKCPEAGTPVWHLFVIQVPDRDALREFLKEHGIATGLHYPMSLNLQPAYNYMEQGEGAFPVAEKTCAHILSLPMFGDITVEEVQETSKWIREFFAAAH